MWVQLTVGVKMNYQNLIQICDKFAELGISEDCWSDDGSQRTNHWTGTLDEVRKDLGRDLTDEEITVETV